jgi:Flp pilus assembly protein TadG
MSIRHVGDVWKRLCDDQRGNVFILFAVAAIPLLLIMGGAVDFARYARYKAELSNAVDAAALALARVGEDYTEAQAKTFVENYVDAFSVGDGHFTVESFDVTKTANGYIVTADGVMKTTFLPLGAFVKGSDGAIMEMDMDIVSEVVESNNRVELAMVFDNTGSMSNSAGSNPCASGTDRMSGLKCAADLLVDTLMTDDVAGTDTIKVALVPFEGAVNIKNGSLDYSWLDWQDTPQAKFNSANFDELETTTCVSSLWDRLPSFASLDLMPSLPSFRSIAGVGHLGRLVASSLFGGLSDGGGLAGQQFAWWGGGGGGCTTVTTSAPVSHKWIYDQLHADDSDVEWAGCVEMRAEPYDILDTTPDAGNPDTLFVPFLWPDEPDSNNDDGDSYWNNYLNDKITTSSGWGDPEDPDEAQRYVAKYKTSNVTWQYGQKDTTFPYTSGPNRGCPRPIVPLTNSKSTITTAIDAMVAYGAMGTYIPTGLVWGWHVLTSNAPFTEGIAPGDDDYAKTIKAIVLLTDGENSVTSVSNHNKSLFSGYNYSGLYYDGAYRLGTNGSASSAQSELDTKTAQLCTNVKNDDILLFTVTFGDIATSAKTLMQNCASVVDGDSLYYDASDSDALYDAFHSIGEDLSEIRLAK